MELKGWIGMLAVAGALSGCGGDNGSDPPDPRADEAAVRKVLDEALRALRQGDGARACSLYTASYERALVEENQADKSDVSPKGSSCERQVKDLAPIFKRFVRDVKVVRIRVRGDDATAVSEFDTTRGKSRVKEFLVRQDGAWKINGDQEPGEAAPPPE